MNISVTKDKHPLSVHVVWMVLILGALSVYRFLPMPNCLFHELTSYPCLSCGVTRAANSLFSGDLLGMFYSNPLAVVFCAGLFFFSLFKLVEYIFRFKLTLRVESKYAFKARLIFVLLVTANWLFLVVTGK
ncbi:MAG: DUF2752 domain-containing protein [candidate division Zixibacteria bacterium]|nr:DUF2752 domain-containing protein [candidate division Zixibacteria bacterium]